MLQTHQVFDPNSSAVPSATFVDRGIVAASLDRHLALKGRPICLVGPYRSGKTSLVVKQVQNRFEAQVHILCQTDHTYDRLLADSFQGLSDFYTDAERVQVKKAPGIAADFFGIRAQLGGTEITERSKSGLQIPAQLTSRALAKFMALVDAVWIIDDLHKLPETELARVAGAIREWQTLSIEAGKPTAILIGSDQTSGSLPEKLYAAAPDLKQRLVSLKLPRMTEEELHKIIAAGANALNVDFSEIAESIVTYSYGYPGICQDLCFLTLMCSGIHEKQKSTVRLTIVELENGVNEYVTTCVDYAKAAFEQASEVTVHGAPNFSQVAIDRVCEGPMKGDDLDQVVNDIARIHAITLDVTMKGLAELAQDDSSVLYLERDSGIIRFREPILRLYRMRETDQLKRELQTKRLVDVFDRMFRT